MTCTTQFFCTDTLLPGDDNIIVVHDISNNVTSYYLRDGLWTPWTGDPATLICLPVAAALPTCTPPADMCLLSDVDTDASASFASTDGGDPDNFSASFASIPDVSNDEGWSFDPDTGGFGTAGVVNPGDYEIAYTVANSAGQATCTTTVTYVDAATVGPLPDQILSPGDTISWSSPYANGAPVVTGLPPWITAIPTGSEVVFSGTVPPGEPPATYPITVTATNCASTDSGSWDVMVIEAATCPPPVEYDVGGSTDPFTGGNTIPETTCTTPDLTDPSVALIQGGGLPAGLSTKQNNNTGAMTGAVTVPTDGCTYELVIATMESFFTGAGSRVFDVRVNGVVAAAGVDPFAAVGAACKVYAFAVPLDPGPNTIDFVNTTNSAVVYYAELVCTGCTGAAVVNCPPDMGLTFGAALTATATYTGTPVVTFPGLPAWVNASDDGSGTVTFTGTAPATAQTDTVTVQIDDGGMISTCQFDVVVSDPGTDTPPTITAPPNVTVTAGEALPTGLQFVVTDDGVSPVNDTHNITGPPIANLSVNPDGTVTGDTVCADAGKIVTVECTATDAVGSDTDSFTITVDPASCPDPATYDCLPGFDPACHLPTQEMRDAHADFWTFYDSPKTKGGIVYTKAARLFSDPAQQMLALPANPPDSLGSYSIARAWTFFLYSMVDLLRTTGDPRILDELKYWSGLLKAHVGDWDGRGYEYIRYENPAGANAIHVNRDTNWLDECMMGGTFALLGWAFQKNRAKDPACGAEADYWLGYYLDQLHVPKWLYRTHYASVGGRPVYTPPASLGLGNAINWDGPDTQLWANPGNNQWGVNTIEHPVRQFAHPAIMNMGMFYILHDYFTEQGSSPQGNWTLTAQEYLDQVASTEVWWLDQIKVEADGSNTWWLKMNGTNTPSAAHGPGNSGLRTDAYSQHINYWSNFLHWEGYGHWANDAQMVRYRKLWHNPPNTAVYGTNLNTMKQFSDETGGNVARKIGAAGYFCQWDDTGYLASELDRVVVSPTSHLIGLATNVTSNWVEPNHYAAIAACELKAATEDGTCP